MLIGWSAVDVTPDRPVILRGQFHARISQHVGDPLYVTALALQSEDGGDAVIFAACDRVSVPLPIQQRIRAAVADRIPDFDPMKLVMNATHTHTAYEVEEGVYPQQAPEVMTPTECADLFVPRAVDAIAQAWESRRPGKVGWAYSHAVVGHNRRVTYAGGMSKMYGATDTPDFEHIEGYEDHGVDILFTHRLEGDLTGVVVNIACPSQEVEGEYYVSSDFWHETREELRGRLGQDLFVLPQCSAAGDQSPHLLVHKREEELMRQRRGLTARQEIARRIGHAVHDALEVSLDDSHADPVLRHIVRTIPLPVRTVTGAEYAHAVAERDSWEAKTPAPDDTAAVSYRFMMLKRYGRVITRYQEQDQHPTYDTEVHVVRLGDVAFASNPYELFLDFGLRIKARSKALQTFVMQLAGTGETSSNGYLATSRAMASRNYGAEVQDNKVGPVGGQVLVDRTLEMIDEVWEG